MSLPLKESNYPGTEEGVSIKTGIYFSLLFIILISTVGIAVSDELNSDNVTISKKQVNIRPDPGNKEALFKAKYGTDWNVSLDRDSNLPRRIVGSKIELSEDSGRIEPEVREFIIKNSQIFDLNSTELKLEKEDHDSSLYENGSGISNIVYQQVYRGIPVYSSRIGATVNDGKLVIVDSSYFPNITAPTTASINKTQALSVVGSDLGVEIETPCSFSSISFEDLAENASEKKTAKEKQVSLLIYPVENESSYEYHLAYKIELAPLKDSPNAWVYFVDANDGRILYRYDRMISFDIAGNMTGTVYPECPSDTPVNVSFLNQTVSTPKKNNFLYSGNYYTKLSHAINSSPVNLTGAVNSRLNFSTKFDAEGFWDGDWIGDNAYVGISENGTSFVILKNFTGSQDSWTDESIDISAYDGKQVRIGFFFTALYVPPGIGLYVDKISVSGENGIIFSDDLENAGENWNLSNEFSVINETTYYPVATTDRNGYYSITGLEENTNLYSQLSGPYVKVQNVLETEPYIEFNLTSPTYDWNWADVDTSYKMEQSNVFYHVNIIHDYFTKGDPFDIHSMDYQALATVDYGFESGNAFSDGTDIYFYGAGGDYESFAVISDVIYHEYTHSVVYHVYPTWLLFSTVESCALDEGWADYFACTINNDSIVGEGYSIITDAGVRDLNNTCRYPDDIVGESHYDSQIVSGAMWDLRGLLGAELTDVLVIRSMKLAPQDFEEYLEDILIVDDENADLNDGTPHINAIYRAFYVNHGIDSEYFDLVTPRISGEYPPSCSYTNNNKTTIAASITGVMDVDPSSINMTVNGETAALINTKISNGYRVEHIPPIPYGDGEISVCLNASDTAGNSISHNWSFFVDAKPPVSNTPEDTEFSANSTASYTGWKLFDSCPGYYWVLCNGKPVVSHVKWTNSTNLSVPVNTDIGTGDFNYTIRYNDAAGNFGIQDTVIITVNSYAAPTIKIISPEDCYSTTCDSVTVFGTVNGTGLLSSVTVNGAETDLSLEGFNGTFTKTVPLSLGQNTIYANITDERGSISSTSVNVTRESSTSVNGEVGGEEDSGIGNEESSEESSEESGEASRTGNEESSGGSRESSTGSSGSPKSISSKSRSNVVARELAQQFVTNGNHICFEFTHKNTPVVYVKFDAIKTLGKVTTFIEELKDRPDLTSAEPEGKIYKYLNIRVGNEGVATPENINNSVIGFKVEKAWLEENNILESSIKLYRCNDNAWNSLLSKEVSEDDEYIYFEAETPGFSPFAIIGVVQEEPGVQKNNPELVYEDDLASTSNGTGDRHVSGEKNKASLDSGFVLMLLTCAFLVVRWRS